MENPSILQRIILKINNLTVEFQLEWKKKLCGISLRPKNIEVE
jgi:hypothetical protein